MELWPSKLIKYDEELALTYLAHRTYMITQTLTEIYTSHNDFKAMSKIHKNGKKLLKHEKDELKNG
jgi:hypothetical protein